MTTVRLAHWNEKEAKDRIALLEGIGLEVCFDPIDAGRLLALLKADPPEVILIDLSRSPAQGRDIAVALRIFKGTRCVPLVFVDGHPDKVANIRKLLPDAEFTSWEGVRTTVDRVISSPLLDPVVPHSALAGYSGTPLPKKLGIKSGYQVLLSSPPPDFTDTLGTLPEGVRLVRRFNGGVNLILWFVRSQSELEKGLGVWVPRVGKGGIWILWQKKASGVSSGLSQAIVRRKGLDAGLVDYKIASVDGVWSGLKFAVRS